MPFIAIAEVYWLRRDRNPHRLTGDGHRVLSTSAARNS